jgi:predicted CXXCH cytochrome family protein
MTPDKACVECHASTTVHADPEFFELHALQGLRCASCHKEHNGDAYLIRQDQALCSDCHRDLSTKVDTELADIADFSESHPEFRPLLLSVDDAGKQEWKRITLNGPDVSHDTGMIFPHDVHLDSNGLQSPKGERVLLCEDCHQTDASNSYMLPVEFEQHCQECHSLTFDPNTPERELPHSNLDAMSATLDEYYAYMALRGGYENDDDSFTPDIVSRRRIPGRELTPVERKSALAWAQEKAAEVKEEVIEFRACGYCHKVERDTDAKSGWRIPDVHISQRWFTKGAFDHASHTSTACEDCHEAATSDNSEQLLMPDIDSCRECHGDQHSANKLQSGCVTCHVFHVPGNVLLGERGDQQ